MPKAVLAGIVFLIGLDLIDTVGLRRVLARRPSEFLIAVITGVTVFAWGVEQGIILAIVLSLIEIIRRQYKPKDFVVGVRKDGSAELSPCGARRAERTRTHRVPLRRRSLLCQRQSIHR